MITFPSVCEVIGVSILVQEILFVKFYKALSSIHNWLINSNFKYSLSSDFDIDKNGPLR